MAPILPERALARALPWVLALAMTLAVLLAMPTARAAEAEPAAADPALEARVIKIAAELRCLVCQNQTIADSHADLAIDLRNQVREMLRKGDSEAQILAYMTARYGDFVLYRPPVKNTTWLLWFGPAVFLVGGVAILVLVLRKRARMAPEQFESDEDEAAEAGGEQAAAGDATAASAGKPT